MKRDSRRRKNARIAVFFLAAAGIMLAVLFQRVLVVRNVIIEGDTSASDAEIIRASAIDMGGSILRIDEAELRVNLESTGRYALDQVHVRLPSTVALVVRDRDRDALVLCGGRFLTLDSEGYVIEASDTMPDDAGVYVSGMESASYRIGSRLSANADRLAAMQTVIEALKAQNATEYVSDLNVSDVLSLRITTRTGIRVELGDVSEMNAKVMWLRSAVADLEARGETRGTLDVSSGKRADYKP